MIKNSTTTPEGPMNESQMRVLLTELLLEEDSGEIRNVESFTDSGLMSSNEGLVVHMEDGREFQLTIVRSK